MSRLLLLQHNSFVGKVRSLLPSARSPDTPGHTIAFKIVAASSSRYGVGMRARRVLDPYVLGRKLRLRSFRSVLIGKATIEAWVVRRRRLRGGIFSSSLWALRSLTILWSTSAYYVQDPCPVPQRARFSRLFNFWLKRRSCCCCCRHRCCRIERDGAGFVCFRLFPSYRAGRHRHMHYRSLVITSRPAAGFLSSVRRACSCAEATASGFLRDNLAPSLHHLRRRRRQFPLLFPSVDVFRLILSLVSQVPVHLARYLPPSFFPPVTRRGKEPNE